MAPGVCIANGSLGRRWRLRAEGESVDAVPIAEYRRADGEGLQFFTLVFHHNGEFRGNDYIGDSIKVSRVDFVNADTFCLRDLDLIVRTLPYTLWEYFDIYYRVPGLREGEVGHLPLEENCHFKTLCILGRYSSGEILMYFHSFEDSGFTEDALFGVRRIPGARIPGYSYSVASSDSDDDCRSTVASSFA